MANRKRNIQMKFWVTEEEKRLIDIQNSIKTQQSVGYKHWATIENLKQAAETLNFLMEHGIGSLEDLSERCDGAAAATARVKADLRATEKEMEQPTLTMKHAATYHQLRSLYEEYRQSRDKEKFLRGHEGEIILFETVARELKRLDAVPLPATKRLRAEIDELTARRTALQSEYQKTQREEREYDTLRQNVEALLEQPRESEPQRQRSNELEYILMILDPTLHSTSFNIAVFLLRNIQFFIVFFYSSYGKISTVFPSTVPVSIICATYDDWISFNACMTSLLIATSLR